MHFCCIFSFKHGGTRVHQWALPSENDLKHSSFCVFASNYIMGPFSLVAWQFNIWTITVCATVNWHNCQLFLSKEFLLLFQWKPQQPENCVLSIKPQGPNTLLICLLGENKFTFLRKTTAIRWDHPATLSTTPPHTNTLSQMQSPPKIPLPSARCFNRGSLS